jgi:hypothetical protein
MSGRDDLDAPPMLATVVPGLAAWHGPCPAAAHYLIP